MIGNKTVLAVIAARGDSKGIPGKNILPIGGRPLIQWTIDAARASRHIDRLILSSDDLAIIDVARKAGCEAPFRRDAALATDEASSIDVVVDVLQRIAGYDIVLLLQPTSPFRSTDDIDGALDALVSSAAPACVSLRAADDHPYWTFRLDAANRLSRFAEVQVPVPFRRQELPAAWCLNGAVYAADVAWFMVHRTFVSPQTVGYPMPAERSLDIDTFADVEHMKAVVEQKRIPSHEEA